MLLSSCLITASLYAVARRGRNLQKFRDRHRLRDDLYRFIVTIVTSLALYLLGVHLGPDALLPLPSGVLLFLTTALPTWLLCLLSGRWYLGYTAALLVETFLLMHLQNGHSAALHSPLSLLLLQNGLFNLGGLLLYRLSKPHTKHQHEKTQGLAGS